VWGNKVNYLALKNEIGLAAYNDMTDQQIADALNAAISAGNQPVPLATVQAYLMENGIWGGIRLAGLQTRSQPLQAAALTAIDLFNSTIPTIDLTLPAVQQMMGAFITAAIMTTDQQAAINALGVAQTTRAMQVFGSVVTVNDVSAARAM
jgi:hypothetical protein